MWKNPKVVLMATLTLLIIGILQLIYEDFVGQFFEAIIGVWIFLIVVCIVHFYFKFIGLKSDYAKLKK